MFPKTFRLAESTTHCKQELRTLFFPYQPDPPLLSCSLRVSASVGQRQTIQSIQLRYTDSDVMMWWLKKQSQTKRLEKWWKLLLCVCCTCPRVCLYLQSRYLWLAHRRRHQPKPDWCTLNRTPGWPCLLPLPPPPLGCMWLLWVAPGRRKQLGQMMMQRRQPQVLTKSLKVLLRHRLERLCRLLPERHCGKTNVVLLENECRERVSNWQH